MMHAPASPSPHPHSSKAAIFPVALLAIAEVKGICLWNSALSLAYHKENNNRFEQLKLPCQTSRCPGAALG